MQVLVQLAQMNLPKALKVKIRAQALLTALKPHELPVDNQNSRNNRYHVPTY